MVGAVLREAWLMVCRPGEGLVREVERLGFRPGWGGDAWWRRYYTRGEAVEAKRALVELGVGYRCLKVGVAGLDGR